LRCCDAPAEGAEPGATEEESKAEETAAEAETEATGNETAKVEDPEKKALKEAIAKAEEKVLAARRAKNDASAQLANSGEEAFQREMVEFESFRKKAEGVQSNNDEIGRAGVLVEILPALELYDKLQAEGASIEESDPAYVVHNVYNGMYKQTKALLDKWKVAPYELKAGEVYDPFRCNVTEEIISEEIPKGTIIEALDGGWLMGDRVLRPAKCTISSGPPPPPPPPPEEEKKEESEGGDAESEEPKEEPKEEAPEASDEVAEEKDAA